MLAVIRDDVRAVFARDPAARNLLEVLLCYPGLHALFSHRIAHFLYRVRLRFLARLISHTARLLTGVEIHPGAVLGRSLLIDHGMGVVIGETAVVGEGVTLYQGVTLGGTGKEKGKRHPTIGDGVVIGAGASVLGNIEVGADSRIGAGAVVVRPVPPGCTVVGVPGRIVARDGQKLEALDHGDLPDPVLDALRSLEREIADLRARVDHGERLRTGSG